MQYVSIKQEEKDGQTFFVVNAIPLKNTNKSVVQKIPHPLGTDILSYKTLEEAKKAVTLAGFSYILPSGEKGTLSRVKQSRPQSQQDYEHVVFDTISQQVSSSKTMVVASAILALSEFPTEEVFDVLFNKLGEENESIRRNAISGICRYPKMIAERLISSLKSPNWVERNSALTCISTIVENGYEDVEQFILPITEVCQDSNSIVQSYALLTLAKVYQSYKKNKKV
jgi:hypothetical protein